MNLIIGNMAVNLSQHASVSVPHYCGNGEVVMPLNELARTKPMTGGIHKHLPAYFLADTVHPIADCELRPRGTALIQKQFAFPAPCHELMHDSQSIPLQINDALGTLSLGFFSGEYNALFFEVNVTGFNVAHLLRPASCLPDEYEQGAPAHIRHTIEDAYSALGHVTQSNKHPLQALGSGTGDTGGAFKDPTKISG